MYICAQSWWVSIFLEGQKYVVNIHSIGRGNLHGLRGQSDLLWLETMWRSKQPVKVNCTSSDLRSMCMDTHTHTEHGVCCCFFFLYNQHHLVAWLSVTCKGYITPGIPWRILLPHAYSDVRSIIVQWNLTGLMTSLNIQPECGLGKDSVVLHKSLFTLWDLWSWRMGRQSGVVLGEGRPSGMQLSGRQTRNNLILDLNFIENHIQNFAI